MIRIWYYRLYEKSDLYQYYKSRKKSVLSTATVMCTTASRQESLDGFVAETIAGTDYFHAHKEGWFTCQYFRKSKLNSSIYSHISSGIDRTTAIQLPVQCGSNLASYPWLLTPVFVACSTSTKGWKSEMYYCRQTSYGNAHSLHHR